MARSALRGRIGDAFSAAELWIEHCAARNRALKRGQRALAENTALALKVAEWTRGRGAHASALRLDGPQATRDRDGPSRSSRWRACRGGLCDDAVSHWIGLVMHRAALTSELMRLAEQLVLTPGTVGNHIGQLLDRLGVANRTQVAALVAGLGLHRANGEADAGD
jgi:hypothetical protein